MRTSQRLVQVLVPLSLASTAMAAASMTRVGCFSSSTGLTESGTWPYQSSGHCQQTCIGDGNQAVLGLTNGNDCYCGSEIPPTSAKVDDSSCSETCVGWPSEDCGANGFWTVWLTGTSSDVQNADGSSSSASSSTSAAAATTSTTAAAATTTAGTPTTAQPSVITSVAPGKTVVVTQTPVSQSSSTTASPTAAAKKSGSNVTPIVVGVVVGIVAVAAIAGGLFFFMRHRRRQQANNEYNSHQANDFLAGGKPRIPSNNRPNPQGPNSSDPEAMAQRRMSDGSIADNEDYSRRILKVTNPDDRL